MAGPSLECGTCGTRKSNLRHWSLSPAAGRALAALRLNHEDEYQEHLAAEREASLARADEAWQLHVAGQCKEAGRLV